MVKRKKKVASNGAAKKKSEPVTVELRHEFGEQFKHASFCNHVTIQCDGGQEFHLSFFEIQPPLLLGEPEDRVEYLESLGHLEARCVGRIVISAGRMSGVLKALVENVVRHMPGAADDILEALAKLKEDSEKS